MGNGAILRQLNFCHAFLVSQDGTGIEDSCSLRVALGVSNQWLHWWLGSS
jgi:hypothetical protein